MSAARHIPALDGVRGFAAMLVLVSHFRDVGLPDLVNHHAGDYGVMLFFILSGFLMGHLYLELYPDRDALVRYGVARVARILPLYAAVAAGAFCIYNFVDPQFVYHVDGPALVRLMTFTSAEAIFWSIGPEFQFYFLFPLVWMLFHSRRPNRRLAMLALATATCLIFAVSAWMPGFSVFAKFHIFMAGILSALLVKQRRFHPGPALQRGIIALSFLFLAAVVAEPEMLERALFPSTQGDPKHISYYGDLTKILLSALVIYGATFDHGINRWIWGNVVMRRLGAYSFSIYLLHMPTFHFAGRLFEGVPLSPVARSLIFVALAIAVAALSYHGFEHPANRRVRERLIGAWRRARSLHKLPATQIARDHSHIVIP